MNIADALHSSARRVPDSSAVTDAVGSWTYAQLSDRASRLARGLQDELGLKAGDRIALYLDNAGVYFDLLFAAWTAGLCVAPVNSKLHPREASQIVADSGAMACFTSGALREGLDTALGGAALTISVEEERFERLRHFDALPVTDVAPDAPAWIFYTSGTTGRAKGATLSHRNLLSMSYCYFSDIDQLDESDTNLHVAPLSHAGGLYSLPHFMKGSHQVVLPPHFDSELVFDALRRYLNVTLFASPTILVRLVNAAQGREIPFENLKTVIFGGAPMYVVDLERAIERLGPKLFHLYGQGESPMTISGLAKREYLAADPARRGAMLSSTGYARTGVEIRIVDEHGSPVAIGEPGEVTVRSDCVMIGYWLDPEATERTIRDKWLFTGDVGSLDHSGLLTIRDRSKDMIISGGSNIYPREIEEVLLRHPSVAECSIVGRPHPDWGEEVVAFVVTEQELDISAGELDTLCLENIARFKRPKHYFFVDELPKNSSGKVIKTQLRERANETMEVR